MISSIPTKILPDPEFQPVRHSVCEVSTGQFSITNDDANDYDADVRNEKDPIRAAYHDVLAWVISEARIDSSSRVLDLGSGTGNLSCHLDQCGELVCVDLSERMEAIARSKSGHILNRRFIKADIFVFFSYRGRFGLGINLTFCDSFRIVAPQCVKRKR